MDPLTAFGLVVNILTACDYSIKAVIAVKAVCDSATGTTAQHEQLEQSVEGIREMTGRLKAVRSTAEESADERNLTSLATRCQDVSGEIITILESIKAKNPRSISGSIAAVVRGLVKKEKLNELQETLRQLKADAHFQLTAVSRSEILDRLDALISAGHANTAELATLRSDGIRIAEWSPEALTQLRALLSLSKDDIDRKCQDYILEAIRYPSMNKRYNEVETAHQATFTWLLNDEQDEDKSADQGFDEDLEKAYESYEEIRNRDHRIQIRHCFHYWLSDGQGIFQISAKPGAGKSTMMKFICENSKAKKLLQSWADGRKLLIGKFFLWKQGDPTQRSFNGMIRSLLHNVLNQAPELIADTFPQYWKNIHSSPWHSHFVPELSDTEVRQAFDRLFSDQNRTIFQGYFVCLFLDGLDEFEGKRGSAELIAFLQKLSNLSNGLKICVSSRAMNALSPIDDLYPHQKMYLHDLTKEDIKKVVRDGLNGHPNFSKLRIQNNDDCEYLIVEVVRKAEGVFLWVTLMMRILCQGLTDEDTILDLRNKTDLYPEDLDEFLIAIIKSIAPENRKLAYCTFAVALMAVNYNTPVFCYSFLEDYNKTKTFALDMSNDSAFSIKVTEIRLQRTRKRLIGHCKELLQFTTSIGKCFFPWAEEVTFAHRSIREIFLHVQVKEEMSKYLNDFDDVDAICQMHLAAFKCQPSHNHERPDITREVLLTVVWVISGLLVLLRDKCCEPQRLSGVFESLDSIAAVILHWQGIIYRPFHELAWSKYCILSWSSVQPSVYKRPIIISFVHIAAEMPYIPYLKWTLAKDQKCNLSEHPESAIELLASHLFSNWCLEPDEALHWIESLFERGLSANCTRYSQSQMSALGDQRSLWYHFLGRLADTWMTIIPHYYWNVVELFLKYGADCSMTAALDPKSKATREYVVRWVGTEVSMAKDNPNPYFERLSSGPMSLQDVVDSYQSRDNYPTPKQVNILKDLVARNQARERECPIAVTLSNRTFEGAWDAAVGKGKHKVKYRLLEGVELEAARTSWLNVGISPLEATSLQDLASMAGDESSSACQQNFSSGMDILPDLPSPIEDEPQSKRRRVQNHPYRPILESFSTGLGTGI